jgi:hypothetical protein
MLDHHKYQVKMNQPEQVRYELQDFSSLENN